MSGTGAGDDLETHVGEGRGDHVRTAVVAVLAHLRDHQLGGAAQPALDRLHALDHLRVAVVIGVGGRIDAADRLGHRVVAAVGIFHRRADFAQRRIVACRLDRECEQIAPTARPARQH